MPGSVGRGSGSVRETRSTRTVWSLSGKSRFEAVRQSPHKVRGGPLRISWVPSADANQRFGRACVGYAIGRRAGGAVVRNRIRRRIRAVMTDLSPPPGDYLVSAGPEVAGLSFAELKALVSRALAQLRAAQGR